MGLPRGTSNGLLLLRADVDHVTGGVGGELGGIHRLDGRRTDAEVPGQVGAQPILEGVLTRRELLEKEVGTTVPYLFIPADSQVPLVARHRRIGL